MLPRKRSLRIVPAPVPLSDQWRYFSACCLSALYSKSKRQLFELSKHVNVALGPKNVASQTSVNPQSAGQLAFGLNVPPVTRPLRKPWKRPLTPATTVEPWRPLVSHAPGLWPAVVTNVPRSVRVRLYEPSWFLCTRNVRFSVSTAHGLPHEPWSSVTTSYGPNLPCFPWPLPWPGSARPLAARVKAATSRPGRIHRFFMSLPPGFSVATEEDPARAPALRPAFPLFGGYLLEWPDHDVLPLGQVAERVAVEHEPVRRHRVQVELHARALDPPRRMVDLGAVDAGLVGGVEAVALGEKVLERARRWHERVARAAVPPLEDEWPGPLAPDAGVPDRASAPHGLHARLEVGQFVRPPRRLDRDQARGVEAEEPDSRLPVDRHVRADVQLREGGHDRQRQRAAQAEAGQHERRHPQPGAAVVLLDRQRRRHQAPERAGFDAPVRKQQVLPALAHDPGAGRQRPRTVRDLVERRRLPGRRAEEVEGAHLRRRYPPGQSRSIRFRPCAGTTSRARRRSWPRSARSACERASCAWSGRCAGTAGRASHRSSPTSSTAS